MERLRVESSNLESVGYDYKLGTLEIEFKVGSVYQYFNVPASDFDQLMATPSKGSYFDEHIKNNYQFQKVL